MGYVRRNLGWPSISVNLPPLVFHGLALSSLLMLGALLSVGRMVYQRTMTSTKTNLAGNAPVQGVAEKGFNRSGTARR